MSYYVCNFVRWRFPLTLDTSLEITDLRHRNDHGVFVEESDKTKSRFKIDTDSTSNISVDGSTNLKFRIEAVGPTIGPMALLTWKVLVGGDLDLDFSNFDFRI